jgi:hypothetical protein
MRTLALFSALLPASLIVLPALADPPEVVSLTGVASDGLLGADANQVRTAPLAGGYSLRRIDCSGSLLSLIPTTWRTDARIQITAPGGQVTTFQPFTSGSTFSFLSFNTTIDFPGVSDPAGEWTFRFYEALDDGGPGTADARWNVMFTFSDQPPSPPVSTDLGAIIAPGASAMTNVTPNSVTWFAFDLPRLASRFRGTYLDIDTSGSVIDAPQGSGTFPDDSEIGLYDAAGRLVAQDDDDGAGYTSALSFGSGSRPPNGDGQPFDGRDGTLVPGRYYLAVGPHNLTFQPSLWRVLANSTQSGSIHVNIRTNMATTAPCGADFNGDSTANSQDFFDFLNAFFSQDPASDFNLDAVINSQDFFDFLTAFFAGC